MGALSDLTQTEDCTSEFRLSSLLFRPTTTFVAVILPKAV